MTTILLTGATGFLGGTLAKRLSCANRLILLKRSQTKIPIWGQDDPSVTWLDIEGLDWEKAFAKPIDLVIHTATDYGRDPNSLERVFQANLSFPLLLLQKAIDHKVPAFINTDTTLGRMVNPYSLSKKQFVDWLALKSNEIKVINLCCEMIYGPLDRNKNLITQTLLSFLQNKKQMDFTYGEQIRDFIYITDVVEAFVTCVESLRDIKDSFTTLQVGTGIQTSIRHFVELAKKITQSQTKLNFGAMPYRENEVMTSFADISDLKKLGWRPQVSLEQGLSLTIQDLKLSLNKA